MLQLWLDQSPELGAGRWRFLLEALQARGRAGPLDPTHLRETLVFSRRKQVFHRFLRLRRARKFAPCPRTVQLRMWEQLNRLYLQIVDRRRKKAWILKSHDFFRAVQGRRLSFPGNYRLAP